MSQKAKNEQEVVSDGFVFITRLQVPGGWIYNSIDKGCSIMGSVFVPTPPLYRIPEEEVKNDFTI